MYDCEYSIQKPESIIKIPVILRREMPPVHAGQILKDLYLEPLGLNQADAADNLGVAGKTLSMLLSGHQE